MSESKSDATYTMGRTQGEEERLILAVATVRRRDAALF